MLYLFDLFGVAVFATTGSLAAGKKKMDLFGVVVVALVTALGGGTIRDLILGIHPIFWISNPHYILVAFTASVSMFVLARFRKPPKELLSILDAFGLAVFTTVGTQKALDLGASAIIAVIMGVMTGVLGGMIRDILSGEVPLILRREVYATASLCGAVVFVTFSFFFQNEFFNIFASFIVTLIVRLAAIRWKFSLPIFLSKE